MVHGTQILRVVSPREGVEVLREEEFFESAKLEALGLEREVEALLEDSARLVFAAEELVVKTGGSNPWPHVTRTESTNRLGS